MLDQAQQAQVEHEIKCELGHSRVEVRFVRLTAMLLSLSAMSVTRTKQGVLSMLITGDDDPFMDLVQGAIGHILRAKEDRAHAAELERERLRAEMVEKIDQYFGTLVQEPTPLYREGTVVRQLLKLVEQDVLIYHDGHECNGYDYLFTKKCQIVRVSTNRDRERAEEALTYEQLAAVLLEKSITFEQVRANVRAAVREIVDRVQEDGTIAKASPVPT